LAWDGESVLQSESENRSQSRSNVFLSATLVAGNSVVPVRVRNLSARGALLDGSSLPAAATKIRLVRGELAAEGQIAWQGGGQAGLRFLGVIDVSQWVRRVGNPAQRRVDDDLAALRRRSAPPVPAPEHFSMALISNEIREICDRLAASPAMTVEVGEELVKLEALAQALESLAV